MKVRNRHLHTFLRSHPNIINRRNVTGDPHSSCTANRDFLYILIFKSRVITAATKVLGFTDKSSEPANYKLPENMMKMRKKKKLNCLHEISAKVVMNLCSTQVLK